MGEIIYTNEDRVYNSDIDEKYTQYLSNFDYDNAASVLSRKRAQTFTEKRDYEKRANVIRDNAPYINAMRNTYISNHPEKTEHSGYILTAKLLVQLRSWILLVRSVR